MKWWLILSAFQIAYMFMPPVKHWRAIYKQTRCWIRGCRCYSWYMYQEVPITIKVAMKDETVSLDFVNSAWNFIEYKSLTRKQREVIDVEKYFNGYRGV